MKQQKSRKAALRAGLNVPLMPHSGAPGNLTVGGGTMDIIGEYETGVARSRNSSPTHQSYYRHDSRLVLVQPTVLFVVVIR